MGREVTGSRPADGGPGGHRWGPDLWEMKWRAGNGAAAAPGGALVQAECGTWRSGLSGEGVLGWEPTSLVSESSASLVPGFRGAGRPSPPRPWGRGK